VESTHSIKQVMLVELCTDWNISQLYENEAFLFWNIICKSKAKCHAFRENVTIKSFSWSLWKFNFPFLFKYSQLLTPTVISSLCYHNLL